MAAPNNPQLRSWVKVDKTSDFPIQNLPLGIFKSSGLPCRVGVAIGDYVLDLEALRVQNLLGELNGVQNFSFERENLNVLLAQGKSFLGSLRENISKYLNIENENRHESLLYRQDEVRLSKPVAPPNYTDFYSSLEHATNVGTMFRGRENALMPNWKHMPIAYHGRASSVQSSGMKIIRPNGQYVQFKGAEPFFGPSEKLDFELELAFAICGENNIGEPIPTKHALDYIGGFVLFNDWSARDIQAWEYQPLGPFLGKNFISTISPWLVLEEALEPFKVKGPDQDNILPYLVSPGNSHYDINLEIYLKPEGAEEYLICRTNSKHLYWDVQQQLGHHTISGCNVVPGDLMASGTISGSKPDAYGSMLELSWNGEKPLALPNGEKRIFLENGDTIIFRGYCEKSGLRIGFGELHNQVVPCLE
jgi:fumarylacetoacetase